MTYYDNRYLDEMLFDVKKGVNIMDDKLHIDTQLTWHYKKQQVFDVGKIMYFNMKVGYIDYTDMAQINAILQVQPREGYVYDWQHAASRCLIYHNADDKFVSKKHSPTGGCPWFDADGPDNIVHRLIFENNIVVKEYIYRLERKWFSYHKSYSQKNIIMYNNTGSPTNIPVKAFIYSTTGVLEKIVCYDKYKIILSSPISIDIKLMDPSATVDVEDIGIAFGGPLPYKFEYLV
jgi:hypothetical protein